MNKKNSITFQDVEDTSFFIVLSMKLQIGGDRPHYLHVGFKKLTAKVGVPIARAQR